jgi:hypothetical protein
MPKVLARTEDIIISKVGTGTKPSSVKVGAETRHSPIGDESYAGGQGIDNGGIPHPIKFSAQDVAKKSSADASAPAKYERTGRELVVGVTPTIKLNSDNFTAEEVAWINHKYKIAEIRIASGAETSMVGSNVEYNYALSQKYLRDKLVPGASISSIRVNQVVPGMNVDEYVSRQYGGRQVFYNQNIAPARANQLMGSF